jgi:hypothetical protein
MQIIKFRPTLSGRVLEHDLVVCTPRQWSRWPESKDPKWSTGVIDGRVFALRPVDDGIHDNLEDLLHPAITEQFREVAEQLEMKMSQPDDDQDDDGPEPEPDPDPTGSHVSLN